MSDGAPPVPNVSIERAVVEHIDLFGEVEKVQKSVASLTADVGRLAGTRTADRGLLEQLDRRVGKVEKQGQEILTRLDAMSPLLHELVDGLRRLRG